MPPVNKPPVYKTPPAKMMHPLVVGADRRLHLGDRYTAPALQRRPAFMKPR